LLLNELVKFINTTTDVHKVALGISLDRYRLVLFVNMSIMIKFILVTINIDQKELIVVKSHQLQNGKIITFCLNWGVINDSTKIATYYACIDR